MVFSLCDGGPVGRVRTWTEQRSDSRHGRRRFLGTGDEVDAARRLYDAIDLLAQINERDPREARVLVQAWWRTGGTTSDEPGSSAVFAEVVTAGQRRGDIRRDVDPELVGALLLDAYVGVLLRWTATSGSPPFSLRDALRSVCGIVIEGLRPDHAPDSPPRGRGRASPSRR